MRRAHILTATLITFLAVGCGGASFHHEAPMAAYDGYASGGQSAPMVQAVTGAEQGVFDDTFAFDGEDIKGDLLTPDGASAGAGDAKKKEPDVDKNAGAVAPPKERVIIYVANMGIFAFHVDETLEKITEVSKKMGGWIQESTNASLVIRVPVKNFDELVAEIEKMGDLDFKNITGTDVTEEFFDLQIRLNNAMVLRDRYIELLKRATKVEESLAIEKELGRITEEIERIKGRLKYLKAHAQNSTIMISVTEKPDVPPSRRGVALPFHWLRSYSLESAFY